MRQAANTPKKKKHIFLHPTFIIFFVAIVVGTSYVLFFNRPKEEVEPTILAIVAEKAESASTYTHYCLMIEESGPGYSLNFSGQVHDDRIYGKIEDYELEIFSDQNKYYIKSKLADGWQEMEKTELADVPALIRDPHYLLQTLLSSKEIFAEVGTERTVNDVLCQTYFLEIPPPDVQLLTRFEKDATLDKLQIYLWYATESDFMYRMAVMMNIAVGDETIQINRVYNLDTDANDFPEGVPVVAEKVTPI
ncbi:MAG: hypothetical protein NUK65_07860 [Firmicutes bacterium]|nr:hypothetical protein [Bacillota bacterium]